MAQTIVLIEDDPSIQEMLRYYFHSTGLEVAAYGSGEDYFAAPPASPSLYLLDIMLPEEDGLSILRKLRAAAPTRKLPVIILTAKNTEYDRVVGLDGGADGAAMGGNLLWVTLGNLLGGAVLLGLPLWYAAEPEKTQSFS